MAMTPFQREYAAARREYLAGRGPATFTFNNKSYSVAAKEETDTARALKQAAADESGRFRSRRADDDSMRYRGERSYVPTPAAPQGPTPEQLAQYEEMRRPGRDAIESIVPEAALLGAPSVVRGLAGLARGAMARRGAAKEAAQPRRIEPAGLPERSPRDLVSEANRRAPMERMLERADRVEPEFKKGGAVRGRGDGCAKRGYTKGKMR